MVKVDLNKWRTNRHDIRTQMRAIITARDNYELQWRKTITYMFIYLLTNIFVHIFVYLFKKLIYI